MRFHYFLVFCIILVGCSKEDGPKALIAEKDLQTYAIPEGSQSFVIKKGEVCAAGKKEVEKIYQYMEVVCPGKWYAWVVTGDPYRIEDKHTNGMQ